MNLQKINWNNAVIVYNKQNNKRIFLNVIAPIYLNVTQRKKSESNYDFYTLCSFDQNAKSSNGKNLLDTCILSQDLINFLKKNYKFINNNDCVSYNDVMLVDQFFSN